MRPEILFPLFAEVKSLPGIGPKLAALITRLAGPRVIDLCWHLPSGLIDRRYRPKVSELTDGVTATLTVTVERHIVPPNRRAPYRVICNDETGRITVLFFHYQRDYIERQLPLGAERVISGKVDYYGGAPQITHPDYIVSLDSASELPALEPIYPLAAGLSAKVMGRAVRAALERVPEVPEWIDPEFLKRQGWRDWRSSLLAAHNPENTEALSSTTAARRRLAFDELFANQLALALTRAYMRRRKGRSVNGTGVLRAKVIKALPYQLTDAQKHALDEIYQDMSASTPMLRLLQGDVGSGKTIVAILALLAAVEEGLQGALLVPTEILAQQHFKTLSALTGPAGVDLVLLTGRDRGRGRAEKLSKIEDGTANIVIGTHALFQQDVAFDDLGMVVIDEQHRFGVHQRLRLTRKGQSSPDVLVMTATPIPRTLTLTAYGDMEVSRITEKPPGRKPVVTRVTSLERLEDVITALRRPLEKGSQVYWVCPLVAESEELDLSAAEERYQLLHKYFGDKTGLIHGRMKQAEKDTVMARFIAGEITLLVATTVIEVGVDVEAADVIVVEHAERFGLAQLHQLRGRVGRGARDATCLLLYAPPLSGMAHSRLEIMRETEDGFVIAEEDLRLRGAGELLGTRQSGLARFRLADITDHQELLIAANDHAQLTVARSTRLEGEKGAALRLLLYLFERERAVELLQSG